VITYTLPEVTDDKEYTPTFDLIRGGELTFTVTVQIDGIQITGEKKISIKPTNPSEQEIQGYLNDETLQKIARQESSMQQFSGDHPLWSGDKAGGVGLFQITVPQPTDDQVWDWKANADKGRSLFNEKVAVGRNFAVRMRNSEDLGAAIVSLNQSRTNQGLQPLTVSIPDFTEEQVRLDAIRGFNGWAGTDHFGFELHEYRIAIDTQGFPLFTITNAATGAAQAIWERVPVADRPQDRGDPNYVEHVLAQAS
jgi:hypothetical protein